MAGRLSEALWYVTFSKVSRGQTFIFIYNLLASQIKAGSLHVQKLWVKADSAREMYQMAIGAHPDQSTPITLSETNTC
jgi:hypothetical protein